MIKFPEGYKDWDSETKREWVAKRLKDIRANERILAKESMMLASEKVNIRVDVRPDENNLKST